MKRAMTIATSFPAAVTAIDVAISDGGQGADGHQHRGGNARKRSLAERRARRSTSSRKQGGAGKALPNATQSSAVLRATNVVERRKDL